MHPAISPDERDPSVVAVAAVSLLAALACTLAHAATARLAGIDTSPGLAVATASDVRTPARLRAARR